MVRCVLFQHKMSKLHIRRFQDGRFLPHSKSYAAVDIYIKEKSPDVKPCPDEDIVCVHWDTVTDASSTFITVTQPDWQGESGIDDKLHRSLLDNRAPLHVFVTDVYKGLGGKLVRIKLRPPVFLFMHPTGDGIIKNAKSFMDILREFIGKSVSPKPDIKVKTRVIKGDESCVLLKHDFCTRENYSKRVHSASGRETKPDQSTQRRFEMIEEEMFQQRDFMEKNVAIQGQQLDEINTRLEKVLKLLESVSQNGVSNQRQQNDSTTKANSLSSVSNDQRHIDSDMKDTRLHTRDWLGSSSDRQAVGGDSVKPRTDVAPSTGRAEPAGLDDDNVDLSMTSDEGERRVLQEQGGNDFKMRSITHEELENSIAEDEDTILYGEASEGQDPHTKNSLDETSSLSTSDMSDEEEEMIIIGHPSDSDYAGKPARGGNDSEKSSHLIDSGNQAASGRSTRSYHQAESGGDDGTGGIGSITGTENGQTGQGMAGVSDQARSFLEAIHRNPSMSRDEMECSMMDAGLRADNLHELTRGLCMLNPGDERIWTAVMDKLNKDKNLVPRAEKVMETVLCLDTSNSINDKTLREMKTIASTFITGVEEVAETHDIEENISIVTFGGVWKLVHSPSNDYGSLRDAIDALTCGGSSPMLQGVTVALTCLAAGKYDDPDATVVIGGPLSNRIILMTDCRPTLLGDEHGNDVVIPTLQERMAFTHSFANYGQEFGETGVIEFVFVPIGNTDRALMESMTTLCKGRLVEGNEITQLCRVQRIQRKAFDILEDLMDGQVDSEDAIMSRLSTGYTHEEREEIKKVIQEKLEKEDNPQRFDNLNIEVGLPPLGTRVIRGPDWKWKDQGGGHPGTVINHFKGGGSLNVLWDDGHCNVYRYGNEGCFDVLPDDDCPRQFKDAQRSEIGVQVERGPDWQASYDHHDGGRGNHGVIIRKKTGKVKVRWDNGKIYDYRFGDDGRYDVVMRDATKLSPPRKSSPVDEDKVSENKKESGTMSDKSDDGKNRVEGWERLNEHKQWERYSESDNLKLMRDFIKGKNSCLLARNGKSYRVCFNLEVERSIGDSSTCPIRKIPGGI